MCAWGTDLYVRLGGGLCVLRLGVRNVHLRLGALAPREPAAGRAGGRWRLWCVVRFDEPLGRKGGTITRCGGEAEVAEAGPLVNGRAVSDLGAEGDGNPVDVVGHERETQ